MLTKEDFDLFVGSDKWDKYLASLKKRQEKKKKNKNK